MKLISDLKSTDYTFIPTREAKLLKLKTYTIYIGLFVCLFQDGSKDCLGCLGISDLVYI